MDQPKILVAIRKRPLSKKEEAKGQNDIIAVKNSQTVIVSEYKQKVDLTKYIEETPFNFDFAFHQNTNNQTIYENAVRPLIDSAFQGAKVTCFAYGQTGSGKTYTMNGNAKMGVIGLYALGAADIFSYLNHSDFQHLKARLSFYEIYCGKLFDLLNKRQELKILEDKKNNINIIGLQQVHITSIDQFSQLLEYGSTQRITSQNSANAESSRSHAILQISLKDGKKVFGKISFIDLAGNQRGADHTDMKKQTRIDGAEINKSLLSLKECIRALDQGKGHTPFRGSKLTMVLKDSFVGFCRTVMIGNVSPSSACSENTLNTLRYADRVKELRKPTQCFSKQEQKARQMMLPRQNKNAIQISIDKDDDAEDIEEKKQIARVNLGIKEEIKRQRSSDHVKLKSREKSGERIRFKEKSSQRLKAPPQLRSRQQSSFGNGKNQMKISQNFDSKKPKIIQAPINPTKSTKQTQKINGIGSGKKASMFNEKPVQQTIPRPHLVKTNSMQIDAPKHLFTPTKSPQMLVEDEYFRKTNGNTQKIRQTNNYMSNSQPYSQTVKIEQPKKRFEEPKYPIQKNISANYNYRPKSSSSNPTKLTSSTHFMPANQIQQPFRKVHQPLPSDWNGMDEVMRNCSDYQTREIIREKMNEHLLNEEEQLMSSHSDSLRGSLDIIKAQMNMLNALQTDKDTLSTRQYVRFMEESIDEKISILQMLREKMIYFCYKLDTIEEIEDSRNDGKGDDEQLLDDLH